MATGVWRYRLDERYVQQIPALPEYFRFSNRWITVVNSVLAVSEAYAWDGCTPVWYLPFLGWTGVPMGKKDAAGVPAAYYPSLVHDALCQFRDVLPISKAQAVALFKQLLLEAGFPKWQASLYATMVSLFGPQDWLLG